MGKLDGVCQLLGPYAFYVVAVRVEEGEGEEVAVDRGFRFLY